MDPSLLFQQCGYITYVTLSAGEHQLFHTDVTSSIGVSAYGFNTRNSYGYPGGLQLEPVQCKSLSFSIGVTMDTPEMRTPL